MPRPKGSKNKSKTIKATVDFAAQLAEKQAAKEAVTAEITSITANIDVLKALGCAQTPCVLHHAMQAAHFCKMLF